MRNSYRAIAFSGLAFLIALMLALPAAPAEAAVSGEDARVYTVPAGGTSLEGLYAAKTVSFQIPDYWKMSGASLHLIYDVSPLIDSGRSSVTVSLNGTSIHSFRPDASAGSRQQLDLALPMALIQKGNNTLTLEGQLRTGITELCTPEGSEGGWLELDDASNVTLAYSWDDALDSLAAFYGFMRGADVAEGNESAVAVPQQGDASELEAAVYALSGLAKGSSGEEGPAMLPLESKALAAKQAVAVVAMLDRLPQELSALLSTTDLADKALIELVKSEGRHVLVVTSGDPELLVKAGRFLANEDLIEQLDGSSVLIDDGTDVDTPAYSLSRNISLTETGDKLTGAGHLEQAYFVALPANRSIADSSKVSLHYRYSRNIDFDNSMVTVLIDGTPIGSKRLSSEQADGDTLTLTIPKNLNVSGNFQLTAAFDLYMDSEFCAPEYTDAPWAYVTSESLLQLNTKDRTELLFNNYPYPFIRDGNYNGIAVVLPEERDAYTFRAISSLFGLLGRYAEGNNGEVSFFEDTAGAEELKGFNIIAIGPYSANKVIRDNNGSLFFRYDDTGSGFLPNEKKSIGQGYGQRIGTVQLLESPYEASRGLLAVTGASSRHTYLAARLLGSESSLWQVYGDAALTDTDGHIEAYRFKIEAEAAPSEAGLADLTERTDVLAFIVSAAMVLMIVLLSLILLIRKYRRRRGDDNEA